MRHAVFVHGVPDTSELWDSIIDELKHDHMFALQLPGFGTPIPDGFTCTKEEYVAWIADRVRELDEPVDIVGHDWGSMMVQRLATTQPDLVRTYTLADGASAGAFKWHDLAQQWQTPEVGEQVMEMMTPEVVEAVMREAMHPDPAGCAARIDDTMKQAILLLYRSAIDVGAEWNPGERGRERPGMILWGRDDPYTKPERGEGAATAANARVEVLGGGHWAVFEHPGNTARLLEEHWASAWHPFPPAEDYRRPSTWHSNLNSGRWRSSAGCSSAG
ncbi:MAG: alpha/beta hydrolase [Acidimicrobiia bacterium]|nr:alpha/beta hydrolase [Acidimicrobiia bacterium]